MLLLSLLLLLLGAYYYTTGILLLQRTFDFLRNRSTVPALLQARPWFPKPNWLQIITVGVGAKSYLHLRAN